MSVGSPERAVSAGVPTKKIPALWWGGVEGLGFLFKRVHLAEVDEAQASARDAKLSADPVHLARGAKGAHLIRDNLPQLVGVRLADSVAVVDGERYLARLLVESDHHSGHQCRVQRLDDVRGGCDQYRFVAEFGVALGGNDLRGD